MVIYIKTDYIKLDQLLKYAGVVESGARAKELILSENVSLNKNICTQRGKKVYPNDSVNIKEFEEIIVKKEI